VIASEKRNLWVILPTLNEEQSVLPTIRKILTVAPWANIVVVDNGSSDQTVEVALSAGVILLREPQKGKGYAIRKGLTVVPATAEAIFLTDADDTYGVENLLEALSQITELGFDMVVGTRIEQETEEGRKPVFKRGHSIGNRVLSVVSRTLHKTGINDSLSGWRVLSPGFARSFCGGASGFEIEAELNAHAYLVHAAIKNIEVKYQGRKHGSNSKLNTYRDGFRILRMNFKLFRDDRPAMAFSLFAIPWGITSAFLVGRSINEYLKLGTVPNFPSLIAGVGAFIVAGLLWITGMILQRIKQLRANIARFNYRN